MRDGRAVRGRDRVDDRQAEAGSARGRRRRRRGRSARTRVAAALGAMPGPSSSTTSVGCPSRMPLDATMCVPGGVWLSALSSRFRISRCRSSPKPSTGAGSAFDRHARDRRARVRVRPAASVRCGREVGQTAGLLAADVGACEQQQVGDEPAHAARRAQRRFGGLGLFAVELVGEQLEVREHARERRAQLVGGVGDELALARQRGLALVTGGVKRAEHRLERARQIGDLVLGLRVRDSQRRVARALDLARCLGQLDDRAHRALGHEQPREHRQDRAGQNAAAKVDPDLADRLVQTREGLRVVQPAVPACRAGPCRSVPSGGDIEAVLHERRTGAAGSALAAESAGRSPASCRLVCTPASRAAARCSRRSGSAHRRATRGCTRSARQSDRVVGRIEGCVQLAGEPAESAGGLLMERARQLPVGEHVGDDRDAREDHEGQCR